LAAKKKKNVTESLEPEANLPEANITWISSIIFVHFQFASGFRLSLRLVNNNLKYIY